MPTNDSGRFGQAVRNTIAGYLEGGGSLPSQYKSADSWAEAAIRQAVSQSFAGNAGPGANNLVNEDAARQCAFGNQAACD